MNWKTIFYNGVTNFLGAIVMAYMAVAMQIEKDGGGLGDITAISWSIMLVGSLGIALNARKGYKSPPPVK